MLLKYFFSLNGANRSIISADILLLLSGGGGAEKLRLKLTSAKVKVEVEAERGDHKNHAQSKTLL